MLKEASASTTTTTSLHATTTDRRQVLTSGFTAAGLSCLLTGSTTASAANEVDFSKVQDLLGSGGDGGGSTGSSAAALYEQRSTKRPTFLTDPTEEFKANEAKSMDFKRAQLQAKMEFQNALDKLQTDPNDGDMLAKDLDELRYLVDKNIGLPLGITKEDVVKQVRRRKAKKFWPTDVEIAYQDLIYEIQKKQSPNKEREIDFM